MHDFTLTKMSLIKLAGEMYITAMRDKKIKTLILQKTLQSEYKLSICFFVNTICNYKFNIDGIHVLLSK